MKKLSLVAVVLGLLLPVYATYSGGSGTEEDPYQISTPDDLNSIGLNIADYSSYFILTADIDMSAYQDAQYNIIGNLTTPFTGIFDGGGHVISNFSCNSTARDYVGLFGWIGAGGQVSDLRLTDAAIIADGVDFTGAVAGRNDGLIQRCGINGNISGKFHVGGIAGFNTGTIQNSCVSGTLSGFDNIGGLAGSNSGTLDNCYSIATVPPPVYLPPKLYWTDTSTDVIQRANLDGTDVEDLVTTGLAFPYDIALDLTGDKMYWTDTSNNTIQRSNLDGSDVEDLVTTGLTDPKEIALDLAGGKMYWADSGSNKIQRANLDGSNVEDLITTGLSDPSGIALDVTGGKMYWTDAGTDKIQRANLNGSSVQNLVTTGLNIPLDIALDVAGGKMYWTDAGTDKIQRAGLNGMGVEDLITTGLSYAIGITLDTTGGKIYWTDTNTNKIQRANLNGSIVEDIVTTGLGNPAGIAFAKSTYLMEHSGGLVGFDDNGTYSDCFWDTDTSGTATSAGGIGKTTSEMKAVSTFFDADWDLMTIWNIEDGQTYPLLRKYSAVDTNFDGMVNLVDYSNFAGLWLSGPLCIVNLDHFATFAAHWLDEPCNESNNWCGGADLNHQDGVSIDDMETLVYEWLNACPSGWQLK